MINQVAIKNFQSIASLELNLGKLTVITGPSNSGKSAILRAIRVALTNSSSAEFVTSGKKTAIVKLTTDTGTLTLERGPGVTVYNINDAKYQKAGKTTPEEARAVIKPGTVTAGKDETILINFAGQFDKPLLVDATGTKVATVMGSLTNLATMMAAIREGNRRKLAAQAETKTLRKSLADLLEQEESLEGAEEEVARLEEIAKRLEKVTAAQALVARGLALAERIQSLTSQLENTKITKAPTADLEDTEALIATHAQAKKLLATIQSAITNQDKAENVLQTVQEAHKAAETELSDLLVELGVCPTCGTEMK